MPVNRDANSRMHVGWAILATLVAFFLLVGLFQLFVALRASVRHETFVDAAQGLQHSALSLGVIQAAAFGLVLVFGVRFFGGADASLRETLSVRPIRFRLIVTALVAGFGLQLPLAELGNLMQLVAPMSKEQLDAQMELLTVRDAWSALALFFTVVIVAPLTEELFFRGLVMRGLRIRHGWAIAWAVSSGLFSLSHPSGAPTIVYAFVAGLLLGFIAMRARSIVASLAMHAGVNFVPIALSERVFPIVGFNVPSENVQHVPWTFVVGSLLVTATALFLFHRFTQELELDE